MCNHQPRVSIGLPVYNGEQFIRETLDSLLAQTFEDFELIISDNASIDKTEEICRAYAAKDQRIRYYRNQQNLGASWNSNRVFELSSGEYFKWTAHDDLHAPDFLLKCIKVLDQDPSVILCHSQVRFIDEHGNFLRNYDIKLNTNSSKPQERFHQLLSKHLCYQFFGVIRASALRMTPLLGNYGHADGVLLIRLGLLGRFYEIPEYLFFARSHPQQSMSKFFPRYLQFASQGSPHSISIFPDYHCYAVWFDPAKEGKILFPHWRILWEYCLSIWQAPLNWYEQISCYLSVLKQLKGTEYLLVKDLIVAVKMFRKRFDKKNSLRKKQDTNLRADIKSVLFYREKINAKTNKNLDATRILGVVAAAKGAENYLPYTIPKIIKQISEIGMGADIIIGLNNGFECQTVIERFSLLPDVQVIHLYTGEKLASNTPAKVFDNLNGEDEAYYLRNIEPQHFKHRLFIIHQKEGLYSAGKIRVLADIYKLLLNSIDHGWIPPALLLTFDAESQILVNQASSIPDLESNGLMLMVNKLKDSPEIDLLGTRNKFAVYREGIVDGIKVLFPNFNEDIPPIQWFIDVVHGKYSGYKWQPGGGTVGRTDAIISLLAVISERYPGTRSEDTHLTILAKHTGFLDDILMDVVSTNRVPSLTDMTTDKPSTQAWMAQMYRWIAACYALELNYGKHNVSLIASYGFPWGILTAPSDFLRSLKNINKIKFHKVINKLITSFFIANQLKKNAFENPDLLQGSGAKAYW